eukprot:6370713-Heterocapsa_arctica.AAC.1
MNDSKTSYDRNDVAIAVPDDNFGGVYAVNPNIIDPLAQEDAIPPELGGHVPDWDIWDSKLVDLKGVAKPPEFRGEDQNRYE